MSRPRFRNFRISDPRRSDMVPVAKPEMHLVMSNRRFPADQRLETYYITIEDSVIQQITLLGTL